MGCDKCAGKRPTTWFLMALSVFALLIWAKQRLVYSVPRSAYAVPEKVAKAEPKTVQPQGAQPEVPADQQGH